VVVVVAVVALVVGVLGVVAVVALVVVVVGVVVVVVDWLSYVDIFMLLAVVSSPAEYSTGLLVYLIQGVIWAGSSSTSQPGAL